MATSTFSSVSDNSTDANFRAWGSGLSAALAAVGLVQTADTGQVNWTTVTHPTLANTSQGYEIWKLNDSLQSTVPYFFKLEYGSSGSSNAPGLWLTTGTGSNGSGTITNPSTRNQIALNTNSTTPVTSYICGDSSGVAFMLFGGSATAGIPIFLCIERSKSITGAEAGTFLAIAWSSGNSGGSGIGFYIHLANTGSTVAEISNGAGANIPGPLTTISNTQASGNIALIPIIPLLGFFQYPLRRVISGKNTDWTNGDTPSISLYPGLTDSYLVFKIGTSGTQVCTPIFGPNGLTRQDYCIIMRFQ